MDSERAKKIHYLLFAFMGLFHKKIFQRFRREIIIDSCLKKNHLKILNVLFQFDKQTLTEICKLIDIEKGSLTTLIDFLEEKNLVVRLDDPNDRRKTLISLTEKGESLMNSIMDYFSDKVVESLNQFDSKEVERFESSLEYVVNFMRKI